MKLVKFNLSCIDTKTLPLDWYVTADKEYQVLKERYHEKDDALMYVIKNDIGEIRGFNEILFVVNENMNSSIYHNRRMQYEK